MKQSVLMPSSWQYREKLKGRKLLCLLTAVVMVGLNVLFTCLRTEKNHALMLIANILTDSLGGCFLVYFIQERILSQEKLYRLTVKPKQTVSGTVSCVSGNTVRYMGMDCLEVTVDDRILFLPANTITLKTRDTGAFSVVSGVIVEVEYA